MSVAFQEHDYIGLSELPSMKDSEKTKKKKSQSAASSGLNLEATELRLGLPGCLSDLPEREENAHVQPIKSSVSGAKRGFADAIDFSKKWGFDGSEKTELFSPRGAANGHKGLDGSGCNGKPGLGAPVAKEGVSVPQSSKPVLDKKPQSSAPAAKAQVVGWPPIRSFRKNSMTGQAQSQKNNDDAESKFGSSCLYVKVSMDGAPYLRKVDLKIYSSYVELSSALEKMFSCFTIGQCSHDGLNENRLMDLLHGSEYVLTYEDKDGDWMLVGDVPWEMFTDSCKRLRIMKSSEAIGLAPRAMEKCKSRN